MIARLPTSAPAAPYIAFLDALRAAGFRGEIAQDHASRTVLATDNSIYRRFPQSAVFPLDARDVETLARVVAEPAHRSVRLSPRGGGTGTNGQSLTDGVVVDLSRHMNRILEINVAERWVRVQSGVVKDQLNAALKPHGLFFAPELSTSNRATIGGMINTDASGQGSCTYGKTRDHVLELDSVVLGGERLHTAALDDAALAGQLARQDRIGEVYRCAEGIQREKAALIEPRFPTLNRCLTGYDLAHLREADGRFDLHSVLSGPADGPGFHRQEYGQRSPVCNAPEVLLAQDMAGARAAQRTATADATPPASYRLMAHCTEKANAAPSTALWNQVSPTRRPDPGDPGHRLLRHVRHLWPRGAQPGDLEGDLRAILGAGAGRGQSGRAAGDRLLLPQPDLAPAHPQVAPSDPGAARPLPGRRIGRLTCPPAADGPKRYLPSAAAPRPFRAPAACRIISRNLMARRPTDLLDPAERRQSGLPLNNALSKQTPRIALKDA
ncbi:hypothetical protein SSTU70S_05407 [Stutzerimonas stutzeri]